LTMRALLIILSWVIFTQSGPGQYITTVRATWDDRFTEWEMIDEETGQRGEIRLRWTFPLDWTQWDIRWGDTTAEFRPTWRDDLGQWDLIMGSERITAQTRWPGDDSEWRIRYHDQTVIWRPGDRRFRDVWETDDLKRAPFRMYTLYEGDPRDWVIEDGMKEDVFGLRLILIMLTIFHSTPK
jgi:hypothetical protein